MNTVKTLAAATLAFASLPLLAQQPQNPDTPSAAPSAQAQPQATQPAPPPTAATAGVAMSPVNGELVDKLDSKTAKTGDSVVVKTKSNVTTADGTQIPKGSKLVGKVVQAKASGQGNDNSQVAVQFDHAELKGGQSMPIRAEIVGISASDSDMNAAPDTTASAPSGSSSSPAATGGAANGGMNGSPSANQAQAATPSPSSSASPSADPASGPAPGTVVARTGNIAIHTTSIPGVLLANNEPGQQDPRMAQASGILLGPKRDIHLDSGTRVVIGVASASNVGQGGGQ
jgi:hypothetical protein